MSRKLKIVYMGTPDFAVAPLELLIKNGYDIAAVITAPDRPAGRGQKLKKSAVKEAAEKYQLRILQPTNLKSEEFVLELSQLNANLQIVVAFRMLPKIIWAMPEYGTFNLHASLLPQYRGAAPINWAIINNEKETGVTTFFLDEKIDTGRIILSQATSISNTDTAGILHDKLMTIGAKLVLETVQKIEANEVATIEQSEIKTVRSIKEAPKIYRDDCKILWDKRALDIYQLIKGLSPYPGAWSELKHKNSEKVLSFKVYNCQLLNNDTSHSYPSIHSDGKSFIHVILEDGIIELNKIQLAGKKKMKTEDLLKGFNILDYNLNI